MKVPFPYSIFSFMRGPVEKGARPAVYAATAPELEGVNGRYFNRQGKEIRSSKISYDEAAAERLWRMSEQLTERQEAPVRTPS